MSTAVMGQSYMIQQKALDLIKPDSWLWSLPHVSFSNTLRLAGTHGENTEYHEGIINQVEKSPLSVENFLHVNKDDEAKAELLMTLAYSYRRAENYEEYNKYYQQLLSQYTHVAKFKFFKKILQPNKLPVGKPAPAFTIADLDNNDVNFDNNSFSGQLYLLDFWATWCAPCIKEMPDLHQAYEEFNDKGFEILSLSADSLSQDVIKFRKGQWSMPWKHGFLDDRKHVMIKDYFIFGYPNAYLIDGDGNVIANGDKVRGKQLIQTLSDYFADKEKVAVNIQ